MPALDYEKAKSLLEPEFSGVEQNLLAGKKPSVPAALEPHFDTVFASATQAYREVLIGCVLAHLLDKALDVHKPYANQGPDAYNGRTLDERVINPFLHAKRIPCSRGPFLSTFRRSVEFRRQTRDGLRDKKGFDSLLALIDYVASETADARLLEFLRHLLSRFLEMREKADVPISRLQQISLEQYGALIRGLLAVPSGGRFPVLLVHSVFTALKEHFALNWRIELQGINVADGPSGVGGDIVIYSNSHVVMAVEVTERPVDRNRVIATFQTKIAPLGIEDYVFLVKAGAVDDDVRRQARQYFSQGHEVSFLEITNWILTVLATVGKKGRAAFNQALIETLSGPDTPRGLKVAWNEQLNLLTTA